MSINIKSVSMSDSEHKNRKVYESKVIDEILALEGKEVTVVIDNSTLKGVVCKKYEEIHGGCDFFETIVVKSGILYAILPINLEWQSFDYDSKQNPLYDIKVIKDSNIILINKQ